jgi:sigma-B regulation protein RsbU (phosphoserine phosphatase)
MTRPIVALAAVARRVGAGDFAARADARGSDEVAELGRSFNAMVPRLQDGMRMQQSLELARAVQQNLLPLRPPAIDGFDIAGVSKYCDETGGDYYDFVDLEPGDGPRIAIAVGDVSGHGIAAALVMASARAALRGAVGSVDSAREAMERANRLLCADITDGSFMTLVLLVIDPLAAVVRWVNAAHDAPLIYHPASDAFVELAGADVPIGIDETWTYTERSAPLPAGEILAALGTDGIWETENSRGEQFGRERWERLVRAYAACPAAEICRRIIADVDAFRGDTQPADDVTLVIVKFVAAGAA